MKKFLVLIIAGSLLISGCNNSEPDNVSGSISPLSESGTMTDKQSAAEITVNEPLLGSYEEQNSTISEYISTEENAMNMNITVNGHTFSATLYDNETAGAFKDLLPLTLDMSELNGNEKYYYLPDSLPKNSSRPSGIYKGDIMLYGNDCLVLFYESFSTSYSYTPIGKIDDPDELAEALGSGSVQVTFVSITV